MATRTGAGIQRTWPCGNCTPHTQVEDIVIPTVRAGKCGTERLHANLSQVTELVVGLGPNPGSLATQTAFRSLLY
jgi:hypothetical protein